MYRSNTKYLSLCMSLLFLLTALLIPFICIADTQPAHGASTSPKKDKGPLQGIFGGQKKDNEPTFIESDSLTLNSDTRFFVYQGHVVVKHGDVTMTAERMEGTYSEKNELQKVTAFTNVEIVKTTGVKAHAQKAIYDAPADTAVLTESPSVEQNGSILTADLITVHLKENRSEATGQVRVKLIKKTEAQQDAERTAKSAASPAPSVVPSPKVP